MTLIKELALQPIKAEPLMMEQESNRKEITISESSLKRVSMLKKKKREEQVIPVLMEETRVLRDLESQDTVETTDGIMIEEIEEEIEEETEAAIVQEDMIRIKIEETKDAPVEVEVVKRTIVTGKEVVAMIEMIEIEAMTNTETIVVVATEMIEDKEVETSIIMTEMREGIITEVILSLRERSHLVRLLLDGQRTSLTGMLPQDLKEIIGVDPMMVGESQSKENKFPLKECSHQECLSKNPGYLSKRLVDLILGHLLKISEGKMISSLSSKRILEEEMKEEEGSRSQSRFKHGRVRIQERCNLKEGNNNKVNNNSRRYY
jgi:hypothetical protein